MHIVLWDTRGLDASKDFAGGFGVGQYPDRGGLRGKLIRRFYTRDRRPAALVFAHLAAAFKRLGHEVEYAEDRIPQRADIYVFCPSLITLELERKAIAEASAHNPQARILVCGIVPTVMPEAFSGLAVTIVKGEPEQLFWKLDEVLERRGATVQLGVIEDLDRLPLPDWSPFKPRNFRIGYDFTRFPTALVQASRGCSFKCNYCPYIVLDGSVRSRNPGAVAEEIRHDIATWGFRSFKFRDPLFGIQRAQVVRLVDEIGRLPRKIQFSIETRIDLMKPDLLQALRQVGLTSITVGMETPDAETLRRYHRAPIADDRQAEFVAICRGLGIRTVAGFLIGFPGDTEDSIRNVMRYALKVNPTYANFNVVTPYPGTQFFEEIKPQIADFDFSHYTVYEPVLKYEHLTPQRVRELHAKCFNRFFFRWAWLKDNAALLWPILGRLGMGRRHTPAAVTTTADGAHPGVPKPLSGLELLQRKGFRQDSPHRRRDEV